MNSFHEKISNKTVSFRNEADYMRKIAVQLDEASRYVASAEENASPETEVDVRRIKEQEAIKYYIGVLSLNKRSSSYFFKMRIAADLNQRS